MPRIPNDMSAAAKERRAKSSEAAIREAEAKRLAEAAVKTTPKPRMAKKR